MSQAPAANAALLDPEFQLGVTPQLLQQRVLAYLHARFPSATISYWEHADNDGETFGFKTDLKIIHMRIGAENYLVIPFVQCQRGDLATTARLLSFYKAITRETATVLVIAIMMSQEEAQMAKELHFEVISFLTDLPQDAPPPASPNSPGSRASRRQSVMWDSVFEATPASKHLPEVKSWQDFFKLCKLTPEQVAEYSNRFEEEALELEQLGDLNRNLLKDFSFPVGIQLRILHLAQLIQERAEARAIEQSRNAANSVSPRNRIVSTNYSLPSTSSLSPSPTPTPSQIGSARWSSGGDPPTPPRPDFIDKRSAPLPLTHRSPTPPPSSFFYAASIAGTIPMPIASPGSPLASSPSANLPPPLGSPVVAKQQVGSPMRASILKTVTLPPPPSLPTSTLRLSSVMLPPPPPLPSYDLVAPPPSPSPAGTPPFSMSRGGV